MKVRLCGLVLAMAMALTGCAAMLERDYVFIQPHSQNITTATDPSALQAKNYQELVSAVLLLVTRHVTEGTVKLSNYTGDAESDLTAACLEVVQKDPLGAYAVDYIKHDLGRIVSYYEATLTISYRRTAEEMNQVVSVTGSSAIKTELREALLEFADHITLRMSYFGEDEDYIHDLVAQAYYSAPGAAFGMPQATMTLYPDSGIQRIVDIVLTYPGEEAVLSAQKAELEALAAEILPEGKTYTALEVYDRLGQWAEPDDDPAGNTAYAALTEGRASSEGMALAYQLLCDRAGLPGTVVRGEKDGKEAWWNIVTTEKGSRHVDCSREDGFGLTDARLLELGEYRWSDGYPLCRDGSATQITS